MDQVWAEKLKRLSKRDSREQDMEFHALVYEVLGKVDPSTAEALLRTFDDEEDASVQEAVVSVLEDAPVDVYLPALLRELPRLVRDAPDWANLLCSTAIHRHASEFVTALSKSVVASRVAVKKIIQDDAKFLSEVPEAKLVLQEIEQ